MNPFGKCEICREEACQTTRDFFEVIKEDGSIETIPDRVIHRRCKIHTRTPECLGMTNKLLFPLIGEFRDVPTEGK
jgi:hypothetical protein